MSQTNLVTIRNKSNLFKKSKSQNTLDELDTEHKIQTLDELNPGDHIVISVDLQNKKYCHAILESSNAEKRIINIIYYDDSESQCSLDEFSILVDKPACKKNGVKSNTLSIDLSQIGVYKVEYDQSKETCLPPEETLEKARKFIGEIKYNIFVNNDEHFSIYCKTGKAAKLFIINPNDIRAKNIIGKELSDKIVSNLAQQGGQILLVNTAKHIATKFPRTAITAVFPAAAEAAGSVIGVGIEGISMGYDIYQKHKEFKEGKVTEMKFKKYIARRVTRGTMGVAGGITGGIIGQMVIPIPVVGAVLGSLVGGIIGAAAGHGEGILIGELVELIDDKINEKKTNEVNNNYIQETKYSSLEKLVFKFDKDILKPENYAHLSDVSIGIKNDELNILVNDGKILENASEKINDEDYEIYVLDDSNEVVTNLNLENSIDENGAINNRKSIDAYSADQLPSNLNVFFKIIDI